MNWLLKVDYINSGSGFSLSSNSEREPELKLKLWLQAQARALAELRLEPELGIEFLGSELNSEPSSRLQARALEPRIELSGSKLELEPERELGIELSSLALNSKPSSSSELEQELDSKPRRGTRA
ncbi:hypothetical protein VE02_06073 [Pseudogymnoascus sp. 03VT05]|nr:hypothetical protein VE02_06073 [Pseudogymnoascus sp. 03VT05]